MRLFDIRTFRELEPMKGNTKEVNCKSRPNTLITSDIANDQASSGILFITPSSSPAIPPVPSCTGH